MQNIDNIRRRTFLKTLVAGAAVGTLGFPMLGKAANQRIVVIGGGTGGATVAKYLRRLDNTLDVTLIEKNAIYTTCYMSNEVLSGDRTLESLQFNYDGLKAHGVKIVTDEVTGIDYDAGLVLTKGGISYPYDRCVVSPGIDFRYDQIAGYSEADIETVPHAWKAGQQTLLLRDQLKAMPNGGTVVIAAPPNPYRCPPAPYERASQIAHYLKQHKPNSKVIILDPKPSFTKQALFEQAWTELYGYKTDNALLEWWSGDAKAAGVVEVDVASKTAITQFGDRVQGAVLNVIPPQKAGKLAFDAGLVDATGWCPVNKLTFESTLHPKVHVIGDACMADSLPKSGFAANSEAKVCASAIHALLNGLDVESPSFSNGCYSLVGKDYAISVVGVYRLSDDGKLVESIAGSGGVSSATATAQDRLFDASYAYSWYNNFTQDVFR
ncbi:FCSD flavin-binding domain-containing protein [Thiothrix unzii]|jgi:sulfide dehydrogenase [flavocytochrome c] flavoprotein subunit|uniref:FCSD flavin-binding domain-containing protein n=1 Tax=Thiothrix unzii TaxID=111769 RepID=UPI002A361B89|nr:FCSD flavin-binding domain-containing protein [Thiothrix unzii]MDX9990276.1 FCSD flavin-binding domain-containing protein [Thiothrix unzii]